MQVEVNSNILNWVIEQAEKETISEQYLELLEKWKAKQKQPTFNQIEKISKATGIPFGYFFLATPPVEDVSMQKYRTVDSVMFDGLSRSLMDTLHDMKNMQEWMRNHLQRQGIGALDFVGIQKSQKNVLLFANQILSMLEIEKEWYLNGSNAYDSFKYLRNRISSLGVLVMMNGVVGNNTHRPLSIDEFRAFVLLDNYAPLIFINSNDSYNGKLFSLLHEFVHVLIGDNSLYNNRQNSVNDVDETEIICNAVTGELLVPLNIFIQKWNEKKEDDAEVIITKLAKYFRCGTTVIARKALDANFIEKSLYNKVAENAIAAYREQKEKEKEKKDGGNYYNTKASKIDGRFLNSIFQSVQEGKTLYSDAFRITKTNRKTFEELLRKARGDS